MMPKKCSAIFCCAMGMVTVIYDDGVLIQFEDGWQKESKFPFDQVRFPPSKNEQEELFAELMEVEVFARSNDNEACGWWRAIIKMMRGEFLVVEYCGWENSFTEIIESERMRHKNLNPPIDIKTFYKFEVSVTDELREYAKLEGVHKEFQKACRAGVCHFDASRGILIVISKNEGSQKLAEMIQEIYFLNLTQKVLLMKRTEEAAMLLKRTEEAARQLESTKLHAGGKKLNHRHTHNFDGLLGSWITEDDFKLLAGVHANHIRIPVEYWAFIQPDAGEPYVSYGQKAQLERILGYCAKYSIFAIIDLHGLPGSQNGEAHSGRIVAIEFFNDYNIQRSLRTVQAMVDWMNGLNPTLKAKIASIQSANEPRVSNSNELNILKGFYSNAFNIINASPFKVPMMFHDGFQGLNAFSGFLLPPANAVIDLHPYHAFPPDSDTNSIIRNICNTKAYAQSFHLPVFFGEWSLASGVPNQEWWLRQMMDTQISVFKNGGAGGTFWALKNKINSNVWSFEQLVQEGIINAGTFSEHTNAQC